MLAIAFEAMGCHMQALAQFEPANQTATQQALATVPTMFNQAEQRFSRFLLDSELMQLNRHRSKQVSQALWDIIAHSLASVKLTNGLISPTVLPQLLARGYQNSFQSIYNDTDNINDTDTSVVDGANNTTMQHDLSQWQAVELRASDRHITLHGDVMLDLGGFAKGLTAQKVAQAVSQVGAALLIDAGGDIVTIGKTCQSIKGELTNWQIELPAAIDIDLPKAELTTIDSAALPIGWQVIQNPSELTLPQQSMMLATSGIDYRHWYHQGKWRTHLVNLIDNKASNIVCASVLVDWQQLVLADNLHPAIQAFMQSSNACNLAQTLSKLCCLLGIEASLGWLDKHQLHTVGLSLIVATPTGFEQWINPAMQQWVSDSFTH